MGKPMPVGLIVVLVINVMPHVAEFFVSKNLYDSSQLSEARNAHCCFIRYR
jgi:hypothetical protein